MPVDPLLINLTTDPALSPMRLDSESDYSSVSNADLEYAIGELDAAAPGYEEARLYASGHSPELFFVSEAARGQVIHMIDGFRLNFAGLVVAIIEERLAIQGFAGDVPESLILHILKENKFWEWSGEALLDTLIDGDHYVIVRDNDDGEAPTLIPSNAIDTRVFYDEETEREPKFAIRRWDLGRGDDQILRANLWYPDRIERFAKPKDGRWERYTSDDLRDVEDHDFEELPVAHLRTRFPYGRPLHYDAYGAQDMIVKLVMTFMSATEYAGWPLRYELNKVERAGQSSLPGQQVLPGMPATPRLRTSPGTMLSLYADSVGQFDPADTSKLMSGVKDAVRLMAQTTRTPMTYLDPSGEAPSGEALNVIDAPVKARTGKQRRSIGSGLGHMQSLACKAMGIATEVFTVWAPDPIISDKSWWETATARQAVGVTPEQILTEAGYSAEQIASFKLQSPPVKESDDE